MAQFDLTEINDNLREYIATEMNNIVREEERILIDMCGTPDEDAGGKSFDIPIQYSQGTGVSPDFDTANSDSNTGPKFDRFEATYHEVFSIRKILTKSLDRAGNSKTAIEKVFKIAMDDCISTLYRDLEFILLGDGWGTRGRVKTSGGISGNVVTLNQGGMAKNFYIGMKCIASTATSGAAPRGGVGTNTVYTVTAVDVIANTVTFDGVINLANGDYLFRQKDHEDSATPSKVLPTGLRGWLTNTGTLFAVNCAVDSQLRGVNITPSTDTAIKVLFRASQGVKDVSNKQAKVALVSANTYGSILNSLHTTNFRTDRSDNRKTKVGTGSMIVTTPGGDIEVVQHYNVYDDEMLILNPSTFHLGSSGGKLVRSDLDGDKLVITDTGAPRLLMRHKAHPSFGLSHPAANGYVTGGAWT